MSAEERGSVGYSVTTCAEQLNGCSEQHLVAFMADRVTDGPNYSESWKLAADGSE
jgi:hypothetical protein